MATLDAQLLEILACPCSHHAPLSYDQPAQTLACTQCQRVFPIQDGIPVLLLDEATEVDASGADATGDGASEDGATDDGSAGQDRHG